MNDNKIIRGLRDELASVRKDNFILTMQPKPLATQVIIDLMMAANANDMGLFSKALVTFKLPECQKALFDLEKSELALALAVSLIDRLRRGSCWCECAIGNPNASGHTSACEDAQELFKQQGEG